MKTAKELMKSAKNGSVNGDIFIFTEEQFTIFCSQLCKEQKEVCGDILVDSVYGGRHLVKELKTLMRNTPEPKLK